MSIMLSNYIASDNIKPVTPSWFRMERYDYCEPINKSAGHTKNSIFSFFTDKKQIKK